MSAIFSGDIHMVCRRDFDGSESPTYTLRIIEFALTPMYTEQVLIQADTGASDAIVAGGGVEPIVKLLSGGPVSSGAIAAVSCLGDLVAGNRCD